MNPLPINEYETCNKHFFIPENRYSEFETYCTKEDRKKITKLKIKPIQEKYKGKNIREVEIIATSYVGIFNIPDMDNSTLIVRPKIGSIAFLQMLHYINEQDIIIQNIFAHGLEESTDFVNTFLHFLIKTIYDLILFSMRKGYDLISQDLPFLKGRVDYLKTISHRLRSSNLIACQYFKFNYNTLINKALKYTLLQIRDVVPQKSFEYYRRILALLKIVDISNFSLKDFNRITYNRLNMKYKNILDFCWLILKNQMVSLERGVLSFPAFCFNSWNIFESFIRKILKTHCSKEYFVEKKRFQTVNEPVDPDIVLKNKSTKENDIVIDVKYKESWGRPDYNEIVAFRTSINAKKGMLIYPQKINRKNTTDYSYEFFDFNEWVSKKKQYLEIFTEKILSYIND